MGIYDQIKTVFQDIIAPEVHAFRGDFRVLEEKGNGLEQKLAGLDQKMDQGFAGLDQIDGVDARLTIKIDGLRTELVAEVRRVDTRIDGVDTRIDGLDRELRTAIDIRERLAALEARRPS